MYKTWYRICCECHEQILVRSKLEYWTAVKCILKYLRRTKDMLLVYREGDLHVDEFTYSNFQYNNDDIKSTSGFVFICNEGAVSWKSFK